MLLIQAFREWSWNGNWEDRSDGDLMGVICRGGGDAFWKYGLSTTIFGMGQAVASPRNKICLLSFIYHCMLSLNNSNTISPILI